MRRAFAAMLVVATPAAAQDHMHMPGMTMPMPAAPAPKTPAAKKPTIVRKKPAKPTVTHPHHAAPVHADAPMSMPSPPAEAMPGMAMDAHHDMPMPATPAETMPGMDMPAGHHGMAMPAPLAALPVGNAAAPPAPHDHYADRTADPAAMARARAQMMRENGAQPLRQILLNLAEYRANAGYRWDGEAWLGGDIDRLVLKSEGAGEAHGVEAAEAQALYARAIDPYFNLEAGLRHDFTHGARSYATIGIEGLASYRVQTAAALFLSTRGELLARLEGWYDQRLTQRLVLQPRVELNLAAQDSPATRTGAGLADAELGLRLRYELSRRFAPYIGVSHDAKTGRTAAYARADGQDAVTTNFVAGVRLWF